MLLVACSLLKSKEWPSLGIAIRCTECSAYLADNSPSKKTLLSMFHHCSICSHENPTKFKLFDTCICQGSLKVTAIFIYWQSSTSHTKWHQFCWDTFHSFSCAHVVSLILCQVTSQSIQLLYNKPVIEHCGHFDNINI